MGLTSQTGAIGYWRNGDTERPLWPRPLRRLRRRPNGRRRPNPRGRRGAARGRRSAPLRCHRDPRGRWVRAGCA